jgi:hypothetical protein
MRGTGYLVLTWFPRSLETLLGGFPVDLGGLHYLGSKPDSAIKDRIT